MLMRFLDSYYLVPELPEVETIRRGLAKVLEGRKCRAVLVRRGDFRRPLPEKFGERVEHRVLKEVRRRAKYLLFYFEDNSVLLAHLGMSGRMILGGRSKPALHDHVIFDFEGGVRLTFNDPRRFGLMELTEVDALNRHPLISGLGPEPLGNDFNAQFLGAVLSGRRASIKGLLMNQKIVAGLGNIYACESLFLARLSPRRRGASVAGVRSERLVWAIREVLNAAIAAGGSSLRDYVHADGTQGYFQHRFRVYGRADQACSSGELNHVVRRLVQSNRSTFYCPICQR